MRKRKTYFTTMIMLLVILTIVPNLAFAGTTIIYNGGSGWSQYGPSSYWHYEYTGRDGNPIGYSPPMQWTWNSSQLENGAFWSAYQSGSSQVDLYAYITRNYANLDDAYYALYYGNTHSDYAYIDQSRYYDQWVYLKRYSFPPGYDVSVELNDFTPEVTPHTKYVGFDEMKFVFY